MASITLEHVSVHFPIYTGSSRSLRHTMMSAGTGGRIASDARQRVVVEALSDVSLDIQHGDRLALIGHNGAGKTTMLRVLAGVYTPVLGQVRVEGRIAPLFDAGLGMDPEATGYENIRLRGLYLGMSREEIAEKTPEIAEFTELGSFLNMPMRTYSLGMQTRLAFAISTSIEPEVLLLDEAIGAGDAAFVEKANTRLQNFIESAGILVLASHAPGLVMRFCNKAVLMEHGRVLEFGGVEEVIAAYHQRLAASMAS